MNGIWDTGATSSVITPKVAAVLGLKPTGMAQVHAAGISERRNKYTIDIHFLPMGVGFTNIEATEATLTENDDLLIGMDIITLGDFSITNVGGETVMSFRVPSLREVDFVAESPDGVLPTNRKQRRKLWRKNR